MASTESVDFESAKVVTSTCEAELQCSQSPQQHASPAEHLISPDHRRRLLEQASKQFRRRRAFSVLNFESAASPDEQQQSPDLPFPLMSPNHREKLLQRATDTLKRHRSSMLLEGGAATSAPPSVVDLWRDEEKSGRGNGETAAFRRSSRTIADCVEN